MELYNQVSVKLSRLLTLEYSTSFGSSSKLLHKSIRSDIYAIYGLVRIADEIVDTYRGDLASVILDELEHDIYRSVKVGYSSNPIVHAFCKSLRRYDVDITLVTAFFSSMRSDLTPRPFSTTEYKEYIYGSAEVVGLMCLHVFCLGDKKQYMELRKGASRLGAAYQKINFLRDLAADRNNLNRFYFPTYSYETFNDTAKQAVINDIKNDLAIAKLSLKKLPKRARKAVTLSYTYYSALTDKLERVSVDVIKAKRLRINKLHKIYLLVYVYVAELFHG